MFDISTVPSTTGNGSANGTNTTHPSSMVSATAEVEVAAVSSGIATKYWLELKAYPTGSARSLWFLVGNQWKRLDNPNQVTSDCVQRAFLGSGSNVRVWFDGQLVKGLIVEGS